MTKEKNNYRVKNISLADQGEKNIAWAMSQMGALNKLRERFIEEKPLRNITIGMALHVTKETAVLVRTLTDGGAEVAIAGCNPLSTQDDVAAALAKSGISVFAFKGQSNEEYYQNLDSVIDRLKSAVAKGGKIATIDDGCDLVSIVHQKYPELIPHLVVGTEETTTGVIRLRAMEADRALKYPVVAVNDNQTKHLFDNYYGTGQSTIDGILRATSILLAGKRFVVVGYGHCGQGVAKCARGMGSLVTVCEVDPILALRARMDGFELQPISVASKIGDIFVTVTGNKSVISLKHIETMKEGAILANSGHFDAEIDVLNLKKTTKKSEEIRPGLKRYTLKNDRSVYLCGDGRLVNLACAEGHPSEVMSLSFCGQALAVEYGVKNQGKLESRVHILPKSVDQKIALMQIEAMGLRIDRLTSEQRRYLKTWQEGT
jgi:adenosylhomocysteinase